MHPHVRLDLVVSDAVVDIVAAGFDAGIQLGEVIDRDMLAVPVTGDIRMTVVGAPSYFARRPKPRHPRDLVEHECLNWHPAAEALPYRWEFTEGGREIAIAAPGRVLSTDSAVNIRLARDGLGLTIVYEDQVRDEIARGELVPVLEEFCEPFPGYYLYLSAPPARLARAARADRLPPPSEAAVAAEAENASAQARGACRGDPEAALTGPEAACSDFDQTPVRRRAGAAHDRAKPLHAARRCLVADDPQPCARADAAQANESAATMMAICFINVPQNRA